MSKLTEELYDLIDAAGFYVRYRGNDEESWHRFLVAPPQTRDEVGQPARRPGQTTPDPDCIQVLDLEVLIIDVGLGGIYVIACRHSGGFGPGDYQNVWSTPQEAFEDIKTLLIDSDIRMAAKEAGSKLHLNPPPPPKNDALSSLKRSLPTRGFAIKDTVLETRDTKGGDNTREPALEINDGGNERAFALCHPRGFFIVRSFPIEEDRWFGDFEHYWATETEIIADIEDFLRHNSLRRRAWNAGVKHAAVYRE